MFKLERGPKVNPNCPNCKHPAKYHIIIPEMGMTVCGMWRCKCSLVFNYSDKLLEEMK